ncbi:hypothetical protein BDZ89DRAFT_1133111 [Hymenopellis radicata]|nr:hypothetical protein BDZ89DRAFT_1133111 [Hymenopellis radicata]
MLSMMNNTSYEQSAMSLTDSERSLNALIEKVTGRIIFHISTSNWTAVFFRIKAKTLRPAAQNGGDLDNVDLWQLLSHSALVWFKSFPSSPLCWLICQEKFT